MSAERLRDLVKAATPGPWERERDDEERGAWIVYQRQHDLPLVFARKTDANLIVYLRNHAEAYADLIDATGRMVDIWEAPEGGPDDAAKFWAQFHRVRDALSRLKGEAWSR